MRNKYPGTCYYCGELVKAGEGHFERYNGAWRVIHAECTINQRAKKKVNNKHLPNEKR